MLWFVNTAILGAEELTMAYTTEPAGTVPAGSTHKWRDKKRYLWLVALVMPSLVFIALGMFTWTGWGIWLWLGPIVILGIVPIIDLLTGLDTSNPPDDLIEALENDKYYRWITFLYLPLQYAGFFVAMWFIATSTASTIDKVGLAVTVGFIGGIGINTAHELGHKKESVERWLSKIALAQSFYGHFYIEHNRGHHVRVATPEDPASSRMGENLYVFWPRTVGGSVRSAWRIEKKRYARFNKHPFRLGNDVLNSWLMTIALWTVTALWLGPVVLPYLVLQAVIAFTLLEAVNFLEHYGMLRQKVGAPGHVRYERVNPSHSWNSNNIATNVLLYHLQRHSDHHANPTRRYQALRDFEESPVLPTGYAGMILLSLVPPLWRKVMDPRVLGHFDGDITLVNLQPRKSEKLLAKYAVAAPPTTDKLYSDSPVRTVVDNVTSARCPVCNYVYEVAAGDEHEGFAAGTAWSEIPDAWCCPDCGVREKVDFILTSEP